MPVDLADRASSDVSPDGVATQPRRRRPRLLAAGAIALVAIGVAALAVESSQGSHARPGQGLPGGQTTTTVQRRTLVEHATVDGTLSYEGEQEVYDRLSGTFTWLPAVGAVIERGGALFRIDDRPVVLMYGSVPAYRALKEGVSDGPDVEELNENLKALGYDPYGAIGTLDSFGEATAAAVRRWQEAQGLTQTGEVQLGAVVFAPGPRRVTTVHVALGEDPPGAGEGSPSASSEKAKGRGKGDEAQASPKGKGSSPGKAQPKSSPASPASKSPSAGGGSSPEGGSGAADKLVLSTTSTRQVVQVQVKADQQQLARVGETAPVTLPDGDVVHGHITSVSTVAAESSEKEPGGGAGGGGGGNGNGEGGSGENATIPVTLALYRPVAHLDKAPVSVELVKETRRDVLAVPATALEATAGGGYAVQALEGDRRVQIPVTPGMFADGYVQVEGAGVHSGLTVTEPQ